jgi:hypothetical protein
MNQSRLFNLTVLKLGPRHHLRPRSCVKALVPAVSFDSKLFDH